MDKLLYSSFFALLAAFITAVISFVKLVNDKEGRVSDHRQEWTTSARNSLADLVSKITALIDFIEEREFRSSQCHMLSKNLKDTSDSDEKKRIEHGLEFQKNMLQAANTAILETWKELHNAYNHSRLHFRLNDPLFLSVERITESIISNLRRLKEVAHEDEKNASRIRNELSSQTSELVTVARGLLKSEWEKIKEGEPAYIQSKRFSKLTGIVFFFILISVGIHAFIYSKNRDSVVDVEAGIIHDKLTNPEKNVPGMSLMKKNLLHYQQDDRDSSTVCNFYSMPRENQTRRIAKSEPKVCP